MKKDDTELIAQSFVELEEWSGHRPNRLCIFAPLSTQFHFVFFVQSHETTKQNLPVPGMKSWSPDAVAVIQDLLSWFQDWPPEIVSCLLLLRGRRKVIWCYKILHQISVRAWTAPSSRFQPEFPKLSAVKHGVSKCFWFEKESFMLRAASKEYSHARSREAWQRWIGEIQHGGRQHLPDKSNGHQHPQPASHDILLAVLASCTAMPYNQGAV